jgi:hypothetical protein
VVATGEAKVSFKQDKQASKLGKIVSFHLSLRI